MFLKCSHRNVVLFCSDVLQHIDVLLCQQASMTAIITVASMFLMKLTNEMLWLEVPSNLSYAHLTSDLIRQLLFPTNPFCSSSLYLSPFFSLFVLHRSSLDHSSISSTSSFQTHLLIRQAWEGDTLSAARARKTVICAGHFMFPV